MTTRAPEIAHSIRRTYTIPRRKGLSFSVVECSCRWTSALHGSQLNAEAEHAKHAATERAALRP